MTQCQYVLSTVRDEIDGGTLLKICGTVTLVDQLLCLRHAEQARWAALGGPPPETPKRYHGGMTLNIPDEVIRDAQACVWNAPAPAPQTSDFAAPSDLAAFQVIAEWARKEALKEAANVAAVVVRARGTAREVADAVYLLRED